jgi:N-sulfoglucosamine sulfohydrolase
MTGLAHRGFRLHDPEQHLVHTLRSAGYHSRLIGEQHISFDPRSIGFDEVSDVSSSHVDQVAPLALQTLNGPIPEPFFLDVGFFETHRNYFEPSSVRDTLYSMVPANLPDVPEIRQDMAAFKASARSLDQGVGAVLNALVTSGLAERTLVICTTDHGLAFPGAKATLTDRGIGVMLIVRGPGGFTGGRVIDAQVSQIDLYPTLCELAGIEIPPFVQGCSLMPLIRNERPSVREAVYAELSYHAAYEPQRAIRTERWKYIRDFGDGGRVLANVDDSPSKDFMIASGWADRPIDGEQLYDLVLDPNELANLAASREHDAVRAELALRLEAWMRGTDDPLLEGPVPAPPGAHINHRDAISADEEPYVVEGITG